MKKRISQIPFAIMRRGFPNLSIAFQRVLCILSRSEMAKKNLYFLKACRHLQQRKPGPKSQEYHILVINRECDSLRLRNVTKQSKRWGFEFDRIDAINCANKNFDFSPFRNQIAASFYGSDNFLRGAIGCFLSHLKAWQHIATGSSPFGIVFEDDVRVLGYLPKTINEFSLPADADLVFLNARMVHGALGDDTDLRDKSSKFIFLRFYEALSRITSHGAVISGPGGDGYLLTQRGARKLLGIFEQTKISMEVDWFLLFHSLTNTERVEYLRADASKRFDKLTFANEIVITYTMIPAFVEQASLGTSIGFSNPTNYIHKDSIFGVAQE